MAAAKREQTERDLCDHAEHAFRAHKQTDQIEAGFIFVDASAGAQHIAVAEYHFEADHIIAGHTVFQTARAARVRRDISADGAIFHARRIRRRE